MSGNYGENGQEPWVPKNGHIKPKIAQIDQKWENREYGEDYNAKNKNKMLYILMYDV